MVLYRYIVSSTSDMPEGSLKRASILDSPFTDVIGSSSYVSFRYILICTYAYSQTYTCRHIHIGIYIHTHIQKYTYTYTYVCAYTYTHTNTYTIMYIYTYQYIYIYICVCIYIYLHIYIYWYTYTCVYIYTYIVICVYTYIQYKYIYGPRNTNRLCMDNWAVRACSPFFPQGERTLQPKPETLKARRGVLTTPELPKVLT